MTLTSGKVAERRLHVMKSAMELFFENGIDTTTIANIADRAGVGEATVYRYFKSKAELLLSSGEMLFDQINDDFSERIEINRLAEKSGIEYLQGILEMFAWAANDYSEFMRFLYDFDEYVLKNEINRNAVISSKKSLYNLQIFFRAAVEKGMQDGTLRRDCDWEELYWSVIHAMVAVTGRLSVYGEVYEGSYHVPPRRQIEVLTKIFLDGMSTEIGKSTISDNSGNVGKVFSKTTQL